MMKLSNIVKSDFSRNLLKLVSGTFLAQLVSILVSPILTRIYSPDEFGVFTLVSSIFTILALISGGRYEIAILLPKKDKYAANLLILSLLLNSLFIVFFYCAILILDIYFDFTDLSFWIYLCPILVFFVGYVQAFSAWFNRRRNYNKLVISKVFNSTSNNLFAVGLGFLKIKANGLLIAFLVASFTTFLLNIFQLKNDLIFIKDSFNKRLIKLLAFKYINFPIFNSFQALMDSFQMNAFTYFIAFFYGNYYLGFFALAIRILMMPMNLIGSSISQIFYQEASFQFNDGKDIAVLMRKTLKKSIFFATPILIVILFFAPLLFMLIFGKDWEVAGVYAQIIAPWILLDFVRAPLSQVALIFNKQVLLLIISFLSNLILVLVLIYFVNIGYDLKAILKVLCLFQSVYIFLLILWFFYIANNRQ